MEYEIFSDYKPIALEKPFAVVKFLGDESSYSEVPIEWVMSYTDSNNVQFYACWWPRNEKNVTHLISSRTTVNKETWDQLPVEFDKYSSSYQTARKRAYDSNYATTDDNSLGKGLREKRPRGNDDDSAIEGSSNIQNQIRSKKKKSTNDSVDYDSDVETLGEFPSEPVTFQPIILSLPTNKPEIERQKSKDEKDDSTMEQLNVERNLSHQEQLNPTENANMQTVLRSINQMMRICAATRIDVQDMNVRLTNVEKKSRNLIEDDLVLIRQLLPLKNKKFVQEFNSTLKTNIEMKLIFEKYILQIGGEGFKQNIYNVLAKVFSNKCAKRYTWKGCTTSKPAANKLTCLNVIKVVLCNVHNTMTENDFSNHAGEWFRVAKQRYSREKEKKDKTAANINQNEN